MRVQGRYGDGSVQMMKGEDGIRYMIRIRVRIRERLYRGSYWAIGFGF